jgi:cytochrome c oxidase assembly factor CtaG
VLAEWQTDAVSLTGLSFEIGLAAAYLLGARRAGRRHRAWPTSSTAAFLSGLAVMVVMLQSPVAAYDDVYWVHVMQHVALMSVAPALLALGAPVTLCLQVLPTSTARRLVGLLHHRVMSGLCGRPAAAHLPLDYYGLMFVYLLTPAYALSLHNEPFHIATHILFLTCGLLFWAPVVGVDPTGWRPSTPARTRMVAAGLPVNAVLSLAVGSWSLLAATELATVGGLLLVVARARRRAPRPVVPVQRRAVEMAPAGLV